MNNSNEPSVLIVSDTDTAIKETLDKMYKLGIEHALELITSFPIENAIERIQTLLNKPNA